MAAPAQHSAEPERLYRIGDVSRLTDTKPFVLRFWETEFPMLQPVKTPKGHRLYRQQDIDLILAIKRLLYKEGFTIPGARRHLSEQLAAGSALPSLVGADPSFRPGFPPRVSAQPDPSGAAAPESQPVLFPSDPLEQPRDAHAAGTSALESHQTARLTANQADALRAVREELRAILTLLGTG